MRVEPVAAFNSSGLARAVARIEPISRLGRAGGSSGEEGVRAAPADAEGSQANADGDTVQISAQAREAAGLQLDREQQQAVAELKAIDRKVRAHEMAHLAAAGPYARSGPSYEYTKGPDGTQYAVGGEVSIDVSPEKGDPEATIRKAEVVRAAAMAPADPSAQDRQVAAAASQMEAQARQELAQQEADLQSGQSLSSLSSRTGSLLDLLA